MKKETQNLRLFFVFALQIPKSCEKNTVLAQTKSPSFHNQLIISKKKFF